MNDWWVDGGEQAGPLRRCCKGLAAPGRAVPGVCANSACACLPLPQRALPPLASRACGPTLHKRASSVLPPAYHSSIMTLH